MELEPERVKRERKQGTVLMWTTAIMSHIRSR